MNTAFPNLIVIGAMKAGTTSLHDYLNCHPSIFMSVTKEVDFFVKEMNWDKGLEWYSSQFEKGFTVRGESSQNYTKRHHFESGVAQRIKECLPDVRLIYLVRDPVARIVSHYHEAMEGGYAPSEGLNAYLLGDLESNHYVKTSSYSHQLEPYIERFGKNRILVVALEDLKSNRIDAMNRMFRFLGVEEIEDESLFDFVRNSGDEKRGMNRLGKFVNGSASSLLRSLMPRGLKDRLKSDAAVRKLISKPVAREVLDPVIAERVRNSLASDVQQLREWTGQDFVEWSI